MNFRQEAVALIDIHAHILPGMDDGSADWIQSQEMAHIALQGGTDTMIVTPHANSPGLPENYYDEAWRQRFEDMRFMLEDSRLPLKIAPGMEVYATEEVPELLDDGLLLTLNHSRYLLIEFSVYEDVEWAEDLLSQVRERGLVPVVAHPERYAFVWDDPSVIYRWVRAGCLMQVNKGSLLGRFGRRIAYTADRLMKHRLAHAIASDTHAPDIRTPHMQEVYRYLCKAYSEKQAQRLTVDIPFCILNDTVPEIPEPLPFD